jgi:hypothetical protein
MSKIDGSAMDKSPGVLEYWNGLLRRSSFGYEGWIGIMGSEG